MLDNASYMFKKRENVAEIEEGKLLSPKFDNDGLIPVITTCSKTKEILMHGYMYPCIKISLVLEQVVITGIKPSLSNFGDNNFPSSISATFSLFLNI